MGEVMKEAAFSLAEAKFTTGDFNQNILQNVDKAKFKIRTKKDNVAGKHFFLFQS
jgi:V-type H+-transporting ATPase subunit D